MKKILLVAFALTYLQSLFSQNLDSTLLESWSIPNSGWVKLNKTIFTSYNLSDSVIEYTTHSWVPNDQDWRNNQKNTYYRNSKGNPDSLATNIWDMSKNNWKDWTHSAYKYNSKEKVTEQLDKTFLGSSWRNSTKIVNTYDSKGYLIDYVRQSWNGTSSNWRNSQKVEYINSITGLIDTTKSFFWNSTNSQWTKNRKSIYTYDSKGNVLSQVDENWITNTTSWRNSRKWAYTYNGNNDVLTMERFFWDITNSNWRNGQKTKFTYDSQGYLTKEAQDQWNSRDSAFLPNTTIDYTNRANGKIDIELNKRWSIGDSSFINSRRTSYFYQDTGSNTSVGNVSDQPVQPSLYPNPARNLVRINLGEIGYPVQGTITSIDGRMVKSIRLDDEQLDLNGLPKGIYVLSLYVEGNKIELPLIKQE